MKNAAFDPQLSVPQISQAENEESFLGEFGRDGFLFPSARSEESACQHPVVETSRRQRILDSKIEFIECDLFLDPQFISEILDRAPRREETAHARYRKESRRTAPEGVPPFLASLYKTPLLTPEQEYHLFRKMNYRKFLAAEARDEYVSGQAEEELLCVIERHLEGARSIRNQIVRANLRLVVSIARRFVDESNLFEDLVSDGTVPLIRAVEIFDFTRGFRFSTYATWAVRNSFVRVVPRNRRRTTRFQTGTQDLFEGRAETKTSCSEHESRHKRIRAEVSRILKHLDRRERRIVMSRFGLDGSGNQKKFREISCQWNISTERVRQIVMRALGKLRGVASKFDLDYGEVL